MSKKAPKIKQIEWGMSYGKHDLERIGLFAEMPYMNGKGYVSPYAKNNKAFKRAFLGSVPKTLVGLNDALFDKEFKRIFEKEAIVRGLKKPKAKAVSARPFISACGSKLHATPGDHYGTFSGIISEFSPLKRKVSKHKMDDKRPFMISGPGKKGGPGYIDITIGKYPPYMTSRYSAKPKTKELGKNLGRPLITMIFPQPFFDPNPYPDPPNVKKGRIYIRPTEKVYGKKLGTGIMIPTGPAKWLGGMKAGCFDKWPEHKPDPYRTVFQIMKGKREPKVFYPQSMALKSFYYTSIVNQNTDFKCNKTNFLTYKPNYVKYLTIHSNNN